jgi:hypothetical protein
MNINQSDAGIKSTKNYNFTDMKKIDVINNDFFEGETIEKNCEVIKEIGNKRCQVRLSSDPSIRCYVKIINGRWEIVKNLN